MKRQYLLIWMFFLMYGSPIVAQPLMVFNHWNLERNPALIGLQSRDIRINIGYHQRAGQYILPVDATNLQIESRMGMQNGADGFTVGARMQMEEAGINRLKKATMYPALAFCKSLSELRCSSLSMGISAGIIKTQFDEQAIPQYAAFDPIPLLPSLLNQVPITQQSGNCFDVSIGICWNQDLSKNIRITEGASLLHFNQYASNFNASYPIHWPTREWVFHSGISCITDDRQRFEILTELSLSESSPRYYATLFWGIPLPTVNEDRIAEIGVGFQYQGHGLYSPILQFSNNDFAFALSYQLNVLPTNGLPFWKNALECGFSVGFDCHRNRPESLKLKCP